MSEKSKRKKQAKRVCIIVMNPQNGEIYALADVPEYNLNEPFTLNYETDETVTQDMRNQMWRNYCISDTYEPGSTFKSIVAAAAFRALADMSEFDSRIDARRLNSLLSRCAADSSSAPAARAMAVQLCGERRVSAARFALESILDDGSAPEVLRSSARCALDSINGKEISQ